MGEGGFRADVVTGGFVQVCWVIVHVYMCTEMRLMRRNKHCLHDTRRHPYLSQSLYIKTVRCIKLQNIINNITHSSKTNAEFSIIQFLSISLPLSLHTEL